MRTAWFWTILSAVGLMGVIGSIGCGDDSASEGEAEAEGEGEGEGEAEAESEGESEPECVATDDVVCLWAGVTGELGDNGDGLNRLDTWFYWTLDMEFAPDETPYLIDWNNHKIRRVNADQTIETMVGTFVGDGPEDQSDLVAPGAPGLDVALNHPTDLQFGPDGLMYFAAWHNHKIRTLDPVTDLVVVLTGRGAGFAGDGAPISAATRFNQDKSIVFDADGNLYISDQRNFRVRKIEAGTLVISTVVGMPVGATAGFSGDGGSPTLAQLNFEAGANPEPSGALAMDSAGLLYIADSLNHRIRVVDFAGDVIDTMVGVGTAGYSGDGGQAIDAEINEPRDIEIGPDGNLYIADTENNVIRMVDMTAGTIDTVVGSGTQGSDGVNGPPLNVQLFRPFGITFGPDGLLYLSDTFNSRILQIKVIP